MALLVRRFRPGEWQTYRDLRLAALKDSPDAFGSTYEDARTLPDQEWKTRLARAAPDRDLPLVALVDDEPAGLAWGRIDPDDKETAYLYQMWADPVHRRKGIGRRLVKEVIAWVREQGAFRVKLHVTVGNSQARALYESVGFEPDGELEPVREGSDLMEQPMELAL